jgi:hypothetical protein
MKDATQVQILNYLANCADDDGGNCFPGMPRIARMARCSERTVIRVIAQLEKDGWISVARGSGRSPKQARPGENRSQFQISVAKLKGCQDVTLSPRSKRVTSAPPKGDTGAVKGDIDDNPPHPLFGRSIRETSGKATPPYPLASEGGDAGPEVNQEVGDARTTKTGAACVASDSNAAGESERALAAPGNPGRLARRAADAGSGAGHGGVEAEADRVMRECGWTEKRIRRAVVGQLALESDKGESPPGVADAMIAAWRKFQAQDTNLRAKWGPKRFIAEGHWRDPRGWHWDAQVLREKRLAAEASMGSYR